jgi:hypothetical protein
MSDICTWLRNASRWTLLASLVYAPWAYGCTTAATIRGLNIILAVALVLWGVAKATSYWLSVRGYRGKTREQRSEVGDQRADGSRRAPSELTSRRAVGPSLRAVGSTEQEAGPEADLRPPTSSRTGIHRWVVLLCGCLLLLGWWMVLNAPWIYDAEFFLFIPRATIFGAGPASVDYSISVAWMLRGTLLLGVVLFAAELSRDPVWLVRLWWTIAIAGGSIAFLGLIQKATGAGMIFWQKPDTAYLTTFFATYYYHANAGAYLNLALPAAIALALRGFLRKSSPILRAIPLALCLLLVVAGVANTSRGGQAIGALLVVALTICLRDILFSRVRRMEKKTLLLAAGVIAFAILAVAGASHLDQSLGRWHDLQSKLESDERWLASRAALRAVGDAGWFGFGPGTFRVVIPYYTNGLGPKVGGIWRFLHEDYLQTLMEWGWVGSGCWALLFFGSMATAVRTLCRRGADPMLSGRQRLFLTSSVLALAGIALHALVDFPLQIASLQLYVAVYVGICCGSSRWVSG